MSAPALAAPLRVLLVEDSPEDAELILASLATRREPAPLSPRFELVHVNRLRDAESRLEADEVDVVLLDLTLPDSQGFETFRRLCSRFPEKPLVILSGVDDEELAIRAVREGAQDYLVKGLEDRVALARTLTHAVERKRSEDERARLIRERAETEAALRARDELLATISHDLKTPLAAIKGQAQLLARQLSTGKALPVETVLERLARVEQLTNEMTRLIDELLDVARLEAGRPLELRRELVDLVALAETIVADWQVRTDRHRIRLVAAERPIVGNWDALRLSRVAANLLQNAVKYSPEGGDIVVTVRRERAEGRDWAFFSVADQGVGIPASDQPRLFERFFRASNVGRAEGSGIGLAGARQIVEQHGGTITVESEVGRGSTFSVRLPIDGPAAAGRRPGVQA